MPMIEQLLERFEEVIKAGGRGYGRRLSIAAGRGENYVQQMVSDGKGATVGKLAPIVVLLDKADQFFVATGIRASDVDIAFLEFLAKHPDDQKAYLRGAVEAELLRQKSAAPTETASDHE